MIEFWFTAKWEDQDGWTVNFTFDVMAPSEKQALEQAKKLSLWYDRFTPAPFMFKGVKRTSADGRDVI